MSGQRHDNETIGHHSLPKIAAITNSRLLRPIFLRHYICYECRSLRYFTCSGVDSPSRSHSFVHTGAGMGVDAGLPTFRGREGLWKAYPPLKHLGLDFASLANPRWFRHNPRLAWGFYGHRLHQYRNTQPHAGFDIIRQWGRRKPLAAMTSNVDGLLHAADFPLIWEIHGRIREFQCSTPCGAHTWSGDEYTPHIDNNTLHEQDMLPECPHCGAIARPNILMFSDARWISN